MRLPIQQKIQPKKKKMVLKEPKPMDISGLWIIPYADFMTVLMIFFLLMFAFAYSMKGSKYKKIVTQIQEEMGGEVKKEIIENMINEQKDQETADKIDEIITKQNLKNFVNVTTDSEQIKIVFANPILFESGAAELKPTALEILKGVAQVIKFMDNEVIVEGHTDNVPVSGIKYKSNWDLSVARAMSVIRYFADTEGLAYNRFAAAGYGEYRPMFPNTTEENRAQNRRIEVNIIRKAKTEESEMEEDVNTTQEETPTPSEKQPAPVTTH
ncbi:MAG: hypothetical protein A2252_10960 [Elusimicrobia bacterium RIFOXYA2_FULL_39_19]|nr:MAG: hypothetical protein A2252_10960 [Elusimicrobia bacterium RIFOXYA2_FULL_39_19]